MPKFIIDTLSMPEFTLNPDTQKYERKSWIPKDQIKGDTMKPIKYCINPKIKKIIFNPPATIVFWEDGEKTVVKCASGEIFNESAGVALCFMKRFCYDYKSKLKKAIKNAERPFRNMDKIINGKLNPSEIKFSDTFKDMANAFAKFAEEEVKKNGKNENINDKGDK